MAERFAVIFDFDGVVLDSETPEYEAHRALFVAYGRDLTVEEWCDTIGTCEEPRRWFDALRAIAPALDFETYLERKRRLFREVVRMEPVRGIDALLAELEREAVPRAVASNANARWVLAAAREMGVHDRFGAIVTVDDVARPKPAPDVYLEASRRLGVEAVRCVAIEDSGPGLAAARAAGMRTVAIPHRLTRLHDLSAADLLVEHAGELSVARLRELIVAAAGRG